MTDNHSKFSSAPCPDCVYDQGKLQKVCIKHYQWLIDELNTMQAQLRYYERLTSTDTQRIQDSET